MAPFALLLFHPSLVLWIFFRRLARKRLGNSDLGTVLGRAVARLCSQRSSGRQRSVTDCGRATARPNMQNGRTLL